VSTDIISYVVANNKERRRTREMTASENTLRSQSSPKFIVFGHCFARVVFHCSSVRGLVVSAVVNEDEQRLMQSWGVIEIQ